jgi:hypothetical protein
VLELRAVDGEVDVLRLRALQLYSRRHHVDARGERRPCSGFWVSS